MSATVNLGYDVPYAISKRYGLVMEEQDYFSITHDKDKMQELHAKVEMAQNAAKRAEAVVQALESVTYGVPVADIAAVLARTHRYTQSEVFQVALLVVQAMASFGNDELDARNESAVRCARRMAEAV